MEAAADNSIGALLRAAFLRGETVCTSDFATLHGFTRQGVASVMKALIKRKLLVSTPEPRTRSGVALIWRCIDMAGMAAYVPRTQTHNPMLSRRRPKGPFMPLIEAWGGIDHADVRVPGRRLVMGNDGYTTEDL